MIDGGVRGEKSPLFFMETAPLLLQFLPQDRLEQSAAVSYESTEIKGLWNVRTDSLPTSYQRTSSEESLDDIYIVEQVEPPRENVEHSNVTYWKLLSNNRPYLLYIISYFLDRVGEWFTYVATINAITHISSNSNTAVAAVVAIRTIPSIFFCSVGGGLADATDRRVTMISLNLVGVLVALLYLPAYHLNSLFMIYLVTFIQASVAAIYDPVRRSIIPLLVPQEEYLQKATTISEIAFATMASAGATFGGIVASEFGVSACSVIDSATYLISAHLMWLVGGKWTVATEQISSTNPLQLVTKFKALIFEGIQYLSTCSFAIFVTLKTSGSIIIGCADVLNVRLSHIKEDEVRDSERLGILLAMFGLGFLIGPLVSERFVTIKCPRSILGACVVAFAFLSIGFIGMGLSTSFHCVCFSTVIRGCGSSVLWINSTLLLQKFSQVDMLGRVMSADYALSTLSASLLAFVAGILEDKSSLSPQDICMIMACVGFLIFVAWALYFLCTNETTALPETEERNVI